MTDTSEWNEEPVDARLCDLAREYNRPSGEVPREAMWKAIAPAVRAAGRPVVASPAPVGTPDIAPGSRRNVRHIMPYAWGAALAAGLVLGIFLEREVLAPAAPAAPTKVAVKTASGDTQRVATATPVPVPHDVAESATPPASAPQLASAPTRQSDNRTQAARTSTDPVPAAVDNGTDAQRLYRLAARQTLVQAEALLTSYRASDSQQRDDESMQQAGRWARDVLTSTRLLLDSPAANDPQMRALFTDLELVLAQIVQLSGAPLQAGERELIERAMRDRDLLPRLRSALPAGATAD